MVNMNLEYVSVVIRQGYELIDATERAIRDASIYKDQLVQNAETIKAEIYNDMNTLVQAIREKYESSINRVIKTTDINVQEVMLYLDNLKLQKSRIEDQINQLHAMLDHIHIVNIVYRGDQIMWKAQELSNAPRPLFTTKTDVQPITNGRCRRDRNEHRTINVEVHPEKEIDNIINSLPTITTHNLHRKSICDLIVTPSGHYVVTGGEESTTCIYDTNHKLKKDLKHNFMNVTLTNGGYLAFCDGSTNKVSLYATDGGYQGDVVFREVSKLRGIAMNSAGDLMGIDGVTNRVYCLVLSTGESKPQSDVLKAPLNIACNSKQINILSDLNISGYGHCIRGITKSGKEIFTYGARGSGDGYMRYPYGICIDEDDYIFIADSKNHRVVQLTPGGRFLRNVLTRTDGVWLPNAVTISLDGKLLVGDGSGKLFSVRYKE